MEHSSDSSENADLSGRQLGDFHVLHRLGRGAMADVYLAEQLRLKRRVAFKVLRPELADDRTYLQRFEIEAQAAASLVHANIVQVYEVGCIEGVHYIAQEYVQGQNLREYFGRSGPPDLAHALSIMRQVAAALAKAAEQGVVHRDIKPENIMLTASGEVKVADFGLARITGDDATNVTRVGITLGTPLYMSPEQIEGRPLDSRSDLYSFGVTCYQMLAGSPPFQGDTALAVAMQHLRTEPAPLESLRSDLPPALCRTVHQMLAKNPKLRFESPRDLLRELRRIQLEQFGDRWPEDLPGWDLQISEAMPDSRAEARRQLEELMQAASQMRRKKMGRFTVAAALLVVFILGGATAARFSVPRSLLANAEAGPMAIPKQATVLRQWYLATQSGTPAAWQSVIDYFPEKRDFVLRAEEQLALIYLREGDFDRAMPIFEKHSKLDDADGDFRVFGLAGMCGILSIRGQCKESAELLTQFLPDKLTSAPLKSLVQYAIKRNQTQLGKTTVQEWDRWAEEESRSSP